MIVVVTILLGCTIFYLDRSNKDDIKDNETILYSLNYISYSGLHCSIMLTDKYITIEMYINGEKASITEEGGYTFIPLEDIPAEPFDLEVRLFNIWKKQIYQESYYKVAIYNAEGKTKLEMIPPETEHLFVYNTDTLEDISYFENTLQLKSLYLECVKTTLDITPIGGLKELKVLDIFGSNIANISALADLKKLEYLIMGSNQVEDISALENLESLKCLVIDHNKLSDISPLKGLSNLEYLQASGNSITDIEALRDMRKLRYLVLAHNQIEDIEPLGEVVSLQDLSLGENKITDVTPLATLKNLYYLDLSGNEIEDYSALDKAHIWYRLH